MAARPDSTGAFNGTGGCFTSSIYAKSGSPTLYIYNHNFISDGTVNPGADDTIVWGDGSGTFTWNNNSRYDVGGTYDWYWTSDITTLSGWQGKGFDSAGTNGNLQLHGTVGNGPAAYQLASSSPLIDNGANVNGTVYGGMGSCDYFGTSIPQGCCYDIAAAEYSGTYSTLESPATPVGHTSFSPSIDRRRRHLNQSWNAIDYTATSISDTRGMAAFSTNATSSTGTYFMLLPYVDPSLSS